MLEKLINALLGKDSKVLRKNQQQRRKPVAKKETSS